jgi:O-antigen/teichoic acid export membrane protein
MLALSFTEISSPFLWGFGRGRADTIGHIVTALAVTLLAWIGTQYSIATTAWLMAGAYAARSLFLTLMASRYLRVRRSIDLLRALRPGLLVAVPPMLACGSLDWLMTREGVPAWLRLLIVAVVAAVVTIGSFLAMRGLLSTPLQTRLASVLPRMAAAKG